MTESRLCSTLELQILFYWRRGTISLIRFCCFESIWFISQLQLSAHYASLLSTQIESYENHASTNNIARRCPTAACYIISAQDEPICQWVSAYPLRKQIYICITYDTALRNTIGTVCMNGTIESPSAFQTFHVHDV